MATTFFNSQFYLSKYPDVKAAVEAGLMSAEDHFNLFGKFEERSPNPVFDPVFYLAQNPDIATALEGSGVSAFDHFAAYGFNEARAIHPTINLGDYLSSNPDVAAAVAAGEVSAFDHLMSYGLAEPRDLGNGVNLGAFANDPVYQEAVASGDLTAAAARVADVSPFLPTFQSPTNWKAPTDLPIPTDFKPVDGEKLVIPAGVKVPAGTELPDFIEPAKPVAPTPPVGSGGGSLTPTEPKPPVNPTAPEKIKGDFDLSNKNTDSGTNELLNLGEVEVEKLPDTITIKLAEFNQKTNNKDENKGGGEDTIVLPNLNSYTGKITIQNMNIGSATGADTLVAKDLFKEGNTATITASTLQGSGDVTNGGYLDFTLNVADGATLEFTNLIGAGVVFNSLLTAIIKKGEDETNNYYFSSPEEAVENVRVENVTLTDDKPVFGTDFAKSFAKQLSDLADGSQLLKILKGVLTGNVKGEPGSSDELVVIDPQTGKAEFFGNIEDAFNTYAVEKDAIKDLESYTLTGGSLDISELKGHEQGGGLLDLSNATIAAGSTVTVKLAELKNSNKGDLNTAANGGVKSDQSVKLPSLENIKGTLVIENMTIASDKMYEAARETDNISARKFTDQQFVNALNSDNILRVKVKEIEENTDESTVINYVEVFLKVEKLNEDDSNTYNLTKIKEALPGYFDKIIATKADGKVIISTNDSTSITQAQIITKEKLTNDILSFGNNESDIKNIEITRGENNYLNFKFSEKSSNDSGSIILKNLISENMFLGLMGESDLNIYEYLDSMGTNSTINYTNDDAIKLIGILSAEEEGTFVFDA